HRSWLPLSQAGAQWPEARGLAGALPGLAEHAGGVGHTLAAPEPDGVVRKVPLFVRLGDRAVPAFGLALATVFMSAGPDRIAVDRGSPVRCGLTAWIWLALRWWKALVAVAGLAAGYAVSLALAPALAGVLLPVWLPPASLVFSSAGGLLWNQLVSGRRIRHLEGEVEEIRDALVRQESAVETLEEDLEAARAAAARSTGGEDALRAQLAEARAQEERTRQRLQDLERE